MKKYRNFIILVFIIEIVVMAIANLIYIYESQKEETQIVREETGNEIIYKVNYSSNKNDYNIAIINGSLLTIIGISLITYVYINKKIIEPFSDIKEMPYELAKGNLTIPVKEQKNKFFGRFTWGMDMLRENLEDNKKREIKYQKEKKTLILSLSHDIRTPLSAIKLYSKALKENLYETDEKRKTAIEGIIRNTDEIEHYISEIVRSSKEDFMDIPVNNGVFYLNEVIEKIVVYYKEKLETIHTDFLVENYNNCLLKGDSDRVIEVIQNVIENAIKYGDGKQIKIRFSEEEDYKLISVINTGCDLKKEELPHIFDSFYRGSNSKKREGSGLGLYICKQLMRKMGGDIFAQTKDNIFEMMIIVKKI